MRRGRRSVILKSPREIETLAEANRHVAEVLEVLIAAVAPGVSTWDLDQIARRELDARGLRSPFLGYYDYPAVLCASVNEEVVHAIPHKQRVLRGGDIISLDFGVVHQGYVGDAARTVAVGSTDPESQRLIDVTRRCLDAAISVCVPGGRISDIGKIVSGIAESEGFGVVRAFVGHGVGTEMHEDPQVPNYYDGPLKRMRPGLVIAIEPMLNAGSHQVRVLDDNWTAVTEDGKRSAHFEDSVAITEDGPRVLSRL